MIGSILFYITKGIPQFILERAIWLKAGRPMREPQKIRGLYVICMKNECGHFQKDRCGLCGCNIHPSRRVLNKLAWATTECPHPNKYWAPEPQYAHVRDGELKEEEIKAAEQNHTAEHEKNACSCARLN